MTPDTTGLADAARQAPREASRQVPGEAPGQPATDLARLFAPRSIALVGASQNPSSISGQPLANLLSRDYAGTIYPVNPKYREIAGHACYPSVADLPETPDLAIVLVSARNAVEAVAACGRKGIPFAIVIGSGFAEIGEAGRQLQEELSAVAAATGVRVVGPNCQGMMNLSPCVFAGFGPAFATKRIQAGPVSMVTQSGGFGYAVVNMAAEEGVGFRQVISTGNEVDLSTLDFIEHMVRDPETRVVAAYVEGLKDARRLRPIGRQALAAGKPVLVWKVGDTQVGKRAAASHTANLGGATELYHAAFEQYGWIVVDDVQDIADFSRAFLRGKLPGGKAVGIVTVSGGAGVLLADQCVNLRLQVPELSPQTGERLRQVLPQFGSSENPVDITAGILNDPALFKAVLTVIAEDPKVDSLLVVASLVSGGIAERIAREIVELDAATAKPLLVSWSAHEERVGNAFAQLREGGVPLYRTPVRSARALGALVRFAAARRMAAKEARAQARQRIDGMTLPSGIAVEHRAKSILAPYGLGMPQERLAGSVEEAAAIADEFGGAVVLKIQSQDIPHKTDVGGVRLGLSGAGSVAAAYREILERASLAVPDARVDGVLVQEMVAGGVETILGVVNDERFGPAIMLGFGGIFAEVLKDVVFRFPPITPELAGEMIDSLRARAVLSGVRGAPPADVEALAAAIVSLSNFVEDAGGRVSELDINPLLVMPEGQGVRVLDALIRFDAPLEGQGRGPEPTGG